MVGSVSGTNLSVISCSWVLGRKLPSSSSILLSVSRASKAYKKNGTAPGKNPVVKLLLLSVISWPSNSVKISNSTLGEGLLSSTISAIESPSESIRPTGLKNGLPGRE